MNIINIDKEPTVFILGAGSSNPYGFPLGSELKEQIIKLDEKEIENLLEKKQEVKKLIPDFLETLARGDYETIDNLLDQKPRYRELGAYYIVKVIAEKEIEKNLFPQREHYADLFQMLNVESESNSEVLFSVVTVNYDRSFEYFLRCNAKYNCHQDLELNAMRKISKLHIIHAHNSLGNLSEVPYGRVTSTKEYIHEAARQIKIIPDSIENSNEYIEAQRVIAAAKNIVFLGFGYHKKILSALFAKSNLIGKQIFGTGVRFDQNHRIELNEIMNNINGTITLGGENQDNSAFLDYLGLSRNKLRLERAWSSISKKG
jgi:hypothetical protein